ncbi:sugar phosphate isomerase/epimerase family protein [Goekera deserti]|uniref:Sugar phosphate isomerase/epimerase n=1 Tax=Goekera deserti TaxID=2497753 RepID=A0A7K3WI87_9ACTN|nr:TIM barrel protein [Goekera deserti]NDI47170.1 TIM barrel protein [Goekera deserti]NEL55430.1 sugar phosphate isomerase/epimerase [Goekera deserti]
MIGSELVLSHFSLGRHRPFEERVRAAAGAGFAGIGLYAGEHRRLLAEGATDADLRAVLDAHGMRVVELEVLRGWSAVGAEAEAYRAAEREVFAMAGTLGPARHVQVVGPYLGTLDDAAEAFAGVCDRAAEHGLAAALEFLPEMTNIPDAGTALELVTRAGRPNGGLCIDVWHHVRGAHDEAMLRRVPPERVVAVQLGDGPRRRVEADYRSDCTRHRQVPGEGEFDLPRFLRLLDRMGVRVPLSVEVLSEQLLALPADVLARRLYDGTRAVQAAAAG